MVNSSLENTLVPSDDCAAAIASQLREGVPCCMVVVGEDSGAVITVACVSVTSSVIYSL